MKGSYVSGATAADVNTVNRHPIGTPDLHPKGTPLSDGSGR
jgi:hypothetical protein